MEGCVGAGIEGKEKRLRQKWRSGSGTNGARSGVVIMVFAVDTLRQCFRVSSDFLLVDDFWREEDTYREDWY